MRLQTQTNWGWGVVVTVMRDPDAQPNVLEVRGREGFLQLLILKICSMGTFG